MPIIPDKVAQFVADVDIAHAIIHGPASGAGSLVATDGGNVRTLARAVAEGGATAAEVAALQAAIAALQTSDLSDWGAATADFLTASDIPAASVTKVAGKTGEVTLKTSDLTDWDTKTNNFAIVYDTSTTSSRALTNADHGKIICVPSGATITIPNNLRADINVALRRHPAGAMLIASDGTTILRDSTTAGQAGTTVTRTVAVDGVTTVTVSSTFGAAGDVTLEGI